jgi:adenylyltransferase/sulfurtransferase
VREIEPRDLAAHLAAGRALRLIDVREPWEHAIASLPGSELVPLGQLASRAADLAVDDATLVVTYCHHGVRSASAAAMLERAGVGDVASLRGGIDAWSREIDPRIPQY